jgi:pimeloyl-ACP methyl ester carboxylesterase
MPAAVRVNGIELAYDECGEGHPFVLVHGFTGSGRDWSGVAEELGRDRRLVMLHQRGHGLSTNTGDSATYVFDQLVDDLAAFVDALDLDSFDLLGHSMGGLVAMRYAIGHPERVRSLIPMDTGASPTPGADAWMQPILDVVAAGGMSAYYEGAKNVAFPGEPTEETAALIAAFKWSVEAMDPVAFLALGKELTTYPPFLDQLADLTMPATVLVGENDVSLRGAADDLVNAIPKAVLEVIPAAAHSPQVENRAGWLAAVERHFTRLG